MSGRKTRTNNAAESSHASLNESVNVSGAVTLDMFLFAIELQMRNTAREIQAGCQPHTKAIFARRDELLRAELAALFRGEQGVFKFLEHCESAVLLKNRAQIDRFLERRAAEGEDREDMEWARDNHRVVEDSMVQLFLRDNDVPDFDVNEVRRTIEAWTFNKHLDVDVVAAPEVSQLSLVENEARNSFLELRAEVEDRVRVQTQHETTDN